MRAFAAICVHVVGFYTVDALMPEWVEMAGAWLLAKWYFAFFFVDLLAMALAGRSCVNYVLAISATWSALLCAEQMLLADNLQQMDSAVQMGLDVALGLYVLILLPSVIRTALRREGSP